MGFNVNTSQHQKHNEQDQPYFPALEIFFFHEYKGSVLADQLDVTLASLMSVDPVQIE